MMIRNILTVTAALLLSACSSHWDMQGVDPQEYYTQHPVENKVEVRHLLYSMAFTADRNRLTADAIEDFRSAISDARPEAVESIRVGLAPSQMGNDMRKEHIAKLLRGMGYHRKFVHFESTPGTAANAAEVDIAYAAVVLPHCPDWRKSPVTTFSNTPQPNFGCASTVNLGLMVADPRDLEKGTGENAPNAERNSIVIHNYKSGQDLTSSTGGSSTGGTMDSSSGIDISPAQ